MRVIILFLTTILLFSCTERENTLDDLKGEKLSYDNFFEKVVKSKTEAEKALLITYEINKVGKTITFINSESVEPTWGFALNIAPKMRAHYDTKSIDLKKESYTVNCNNGNKSWSKPCDGKYSCGTSINKCLEEGGCATICKNKMLYIPEINEFFIGENLFELAEIEK